LTFFISRQASALLLCFRNLLNAVKKLTPKSTPPLHHTVCLLICWYSSWRSALVCWKRLFSLSSHRVKEGVSKGRGAVQFGYSSK
jgi:hypothetical protein